MLRQTRFELFKMSRRLRSYTGFGAFLVINILMMVGAKYGGLGQELAGDLGGQGLQIVGSPVNAGFMSWIVVGSPMANLILIMFMPIFVCLIFGEILAGEKSEGTLRTALARPISRSSFFAAKFVSSMIHSLSLVFFLGISAYVIGLIFFGRGGLLTIGNFEKPMVAWFAETEGLTRLVLAYGLTFVAVSTLGTIALFISTWLNNSLAAVGGAIMLMFTMLVAGQIPKFAPAKDYLFTTHLFVGQNAFMDPIPWNQIGGSLVCLGAYIIVLFAVSLFIVRRKDVLA